MKGMLLAAAAALAACQGTAPARNTNASGADKSAVLVKARLYLPSGEIRAGSVDLNLESATRRYRLRAFPDDTTLYVVAPGVYRLSPIRGFFGGVRPELSVDFNGRVYKIPYPLGLLRREPITVKAGRVASLGILEARLSRVEGSSQPEMSFAWIDDPVSRKSLVEDMIHKMMDMKVDPDIRENAVAWTRALDLALVELQGVPDAAPSYKPAAR